MDIQVDTQNHIPFIIKNAEICIFPNKETIDVSVIKPIQAHTNNILEIVYGDEGLENCDGLCTQKKDVRLAIGTSDCAPVCFISPKKVGIVHCGWRGLVSGIVEHMKSVFDMEHTTVYVAPFLHRFEIQKDFCFDEIQTRFGDTYFSYEGDRLFFEFKNVLADVIARPIIWDSRNTHDDISLPSHRRGDVYNFVTTIKMM